MPKSKAAGCTRRQMLKVGGPATFAGYAVGVEKAPDAWKRCTGLFAKSLKA